MGINFLWKCWKIPVVKTVYSSIKRLYEKVKNRNVLFKFGFDATEAVLYTISRPLIRYKTPIDCVDRVLCFAIDSLTSLCPFLLLPPTKVVRKVKYSVPRPIWACIVLVSMIGKVAIYLHSAWKFANMGFAEHLFYIPRVILQILGRTTIDKCEKRMACSTNLSKCEKRKYYSESDVGEDDDEVSLNEGIKKSMLSCPSSTCSTDEFFTPECSDMSTHGTDGSPDYIEVSFCESANVVTDFCQASTSKES